MEAEKAGHKLNLPRRSDGNIEEFHGNILAPNYPFFFTGKWERENIHL